LGRGLEKNMWIKNKFKSFLKDTSGNVAMMFGIAMVPVLMATGMAVDISRAHSARQTLQNAADTAVLQASVLIGDEQELQQKARDIFDANVNFVDFNVTDFELTEDEDGNLSVYARGNIPAKFAQINGYPRLNVSIGSSAIADAGMDLEMVIAFDTTASMGFGNSWTVATGTLQNVLEEIEEYSGTNNFFVSLVPFADRVRVGATRTNWLSGATPANWNGCVEPREEDNGTVTWALDDDKPTGTDKFEASIPGTTGGLAGAFVGAPRCPTVAVVPPTNDVQTVIDAANMFTTGGTGRFDVAMAWAWRMMSSDWRGHWSANGNAAANNGHERRKIAIMVTDGKTEAYTHEVDQVSSWGWNNGSVGGFENMVAVCDGMKADDMEIFMIRVNGNANATSYMQDCASTDEHYYEISDNAELELALQEVLRVVKENVILVH
jgi:hypothetical protein